MGITIYYRGSIEDLSLIEPIQNEIMAYCQSMNWNYQLWNLNLSKPFNARLVHEPKGIKIQGHIPLRGVSIFSDPKNEVLDVMFNPEGRLSSFMQEIMIHDGSLTWDQAWLFVKTQYGSVDAHIGIIKLLQLLKQSYIPNLEVHDEGQYWETANRERLMALRGYIFGKMNQLQKALSSIQFDHEPSEEEVLRKINSIIKKIMRKRPG
ncbi:MAG: hypothetical protein ONB31_00160 [candidate division KSB1 bacterium]|nr:hypothetical protein [candidate division KSB1 bacterium]MDZ7336295.1 hypothetical protein [candidate division KSB1 bacterium]MDZ7356959.1 hypothetical protein [candidate division KSB1 bacterium]MDZ7400086.1 hypothetical protein [candidate division KSB1 bacterium]